MPTTARSRLARARLVARTPRFAKMRRYAMVSVISTGLSLGILALTFGVWRLASAAWCNVIATAIATVPSYYLNRSWAWGRTGKSHMMKEIVPFWTIAFISLVLSTGAVKLASYEAHRVTHSHEVITLIVELANLCTYAILWVAKYIIFNKVLFNSDHSTNDEGDLDTELSPARGPLKPTPT